MSKPFPLNWRKDFDVFDNTVWEANSPWHEEGIPFEFRIKQRLRDNKHEFYDASDAELSTGNDQSWPTLEEAKAALQNDADNLDEKD